MTSEILQRQKRQRRRNALLLWLILGLVVAGTVLWLWQQRQQAQANRQQVTGAAAVIDGDTLQLGGTKVRLYGIDAPESAQTCQRGRQTYPCGREAAQALAGLLWNQVVTCQRRDTDRYGRTVAVCRTPLVGDVNAWMVSRGYALAYRSYSTDYVPQENAARKAKLGLHAGSYVNPADYRRGETAPATSASPRAPFKTCAEARAAGKTPVLRGEGGYNPKLDGDGDGKMCE